jgi:hypothetical protein
MRVYGRTGPGGFNGGGAATLGRPTPKPKLDNRYIQGARGIGARFLKLSPASAFSPIMTKFSQYTQHSTCYSVPEVLPGHPRSKVFKQILQYQYFQHETKRYCRSKQLLLLIDQENKLCRSATHSLNHMQRAKLAERKIGRKI